MGLFVLPLARVWEKQTSQQQEPNQHDDETYGSCSLHSAVSKQCAAEDPSPHWRGALWGFHDCRRARKEVKNIHLFTLICIFGDARR